MMDGLIETAWTPKKAAAKESKINMKDIKDMNKEQFKKTVKAHKDAIDQLKQDIKKHKLLIKQAEIVYKISKMTKEK